MVEPEFNNPLEADAHNWDTREIKTTDQELIKNIAREIYMDFFAAKKVLDIIKEAGYKSPDEVEQACLGASNKTLELIETGKLKLKGYVKLAEDQTLPPIPSFQYDTLEDRTLLQRGAINYSKLLSLWRKVKLEE